MSRRFLSACLFLLIPGTLAAQTFPAGDSVLRRIWRLGMDSSEIYPLAQALMDSIGPG
jgi:hypothetical protein